MTPASSRPRPGTEGTSTPRVERHVSIPLPRGRRETLPCWPRSGPQKGRLYWLRARGRQGLQEGRPGASPVLGVGVLVVVVPVVGVVEGTGVVVGVGREDKGGGEDVQTLKYFSTVPLGPQISQ